MSCTEISSSNTYLVHVRSSSPHHVLSVIIHHIQSLLILHSTIHKEQIKIVEIVSLHFFSTFYMYLKCAWSFTPTCRCVKEVKYYSPYIHLTPSILHITTEIKGLKIHSIQTLTFLKIYNLGFKTSVI